MTQAPYFCLPILHNDAQIPYDGERDTRASLPKVMKNVLKFTVAALLVCGTSVASAAEDKARFEATGFLQSLDLFIAEQVAKLRSDESKEKKEEIKDLELSLRDPSSGTAEQGFFYLRDRSAPQPGAQTGMGVIGNPGDRPDFSSLLAPTGTVRGSYGQDVLDASSRTGFNLPLSSNPHAAGLEISLESNYRLSMQGIPALSPLATSDMAERNYNFGVTVGYSGFNLDASMMRQESLFERDISGYGVGFSYQASA